MENEINVMLWIKIMGPYACMYVMCIEIFFHYVMLVRTRTFAIYVRHYIMRVFPFLWRLVICNVLGPKPITKQLTSQKLAISRVEAYDFLRVA